MKRINKILLASCVTALGACGSSNDGTPPVAAFTATCVEFLCQFDPSTSQDNYGGGLVYSWNFGDNKTASSTGTVRHPYELSANFNVTLTVSDSQGKSDSITRTITVQGDSTAPYYNYIHDSFALLLLTHETLRSAYMEAEKVQALAETEGETGTDITRNCTVAGDITLKQWIDTSMDGQINNAESLKFSLADCQFTTGIDSISTAGVATITGDVGAASFKYSTGDLVQFGMNIEPYENWGINGLLDFTTDNSGAEQRFEYSGTDVKHVLKGAGLNVLATVNGTSEISAEVSDLSGIDGKYAYKVGSVTLSGTIIDPLTFEKNTGAMQPNDISMSSDVFMLTSGKTSIKVGTATVYVSPDADPNYLVIEVDADTDGDIDRAGRYLQTIAIEPLSNRK